MIHPTVSSRPALTRVLLTVATIAATVVAAGSASAEIAPSRSWHQLVSSNGHTGVVVDLENAYVHHFREHVFATEEPRWQEDGTELWRPTEPGGDCWQPQSVFSRDLLDAAFFGIASGETATWLSDLSTDMDASGYDGVPSRDGRDGGTGIMRMVQPVGDTGLVATTRIFAPWQYDGAAFALLLEVRNDADEARADVRAYAKLDAHLGFGRPGPEQTIGAEFETIQRDGTNGVLEQGFAGAIMARAIGPIETIALPPSGIDAAVAAGEPLDRGDEGPTLMDDAISGYQWSLGTIEPGASAWVGLVVGYDPNPDAVELLRSRVDGWIDGRGARALWSGERDVWGSFQDSVVVPEGLSAAEEDLYRHSATILRMAQVREESHFLRHEVVPGEVRYTGIDGEVFRIPEEGTVVRHRARGSLVASLPPGRWAYSWIRDAAYGIVGMTDAGMYDEAKEALAFFMRAYNGRYRDVRELDGVPLEPYGVTLTRYHGFGVEESDTLCGGDFNFEWDGFGLFLWALRHYVEESGDTEFLAESWTHMRDLVADVIIGLIEDDTGLMWPDSSIWEVHWLGKQKHFAYTSLTAARGLCDAAWMADAMGEDDRAGTYDEAARALRRAIFDRLSAPGGAIAANTEELAAGSGYWDAAANEAFSMGLFGPDGVTGPATLSAIRTHLTTFSEMGIFRNDDEFDGHDLTPYGGPYDSLEWVFLDLRTSIGARHLGETDYADDLQEWVRDQSLLNFLLIGENYDAATGEYRNNAPMIGFGAGSYITALRQRAGDWELDAACDVYFEDDPDFGPDETGGDDVGVPDAGPVDAGPGDAGPGDAGPDDVGGPDSGDADAGPDVPPTDVRGGDAPDGGDDAGASDDVAPDETERDAEPADSTDGSESDSGATADTEADGDDDDAATPDTAPDEGTGSSDSGDAGTDADDGTSGSSGGGGGGCAIADSGSNGDLPGAAGVLMLLAIALAPSIRRRRRLRSA